MFITLKPLDERKIGAQALIVQLQRQLGKVPGAVCVLQPMQDIRAPGGRSSAGLYQFTLAGDDLQELQTWAPKVTARLQKIPGMAQVTSDLQTHGLQSYIDIDRDTASRLGITAKQIDDLLYDAFGQRQVSTMYKSMNQYHVVMEVRGQSRVAGQHVCPRGERRPDSAVSLRPLLAEFHALVSDAPVAIPVRDDLVQPAARSVAGRRGDEH
jgi:multidrug efflux pump subunit AcrB